MKPSLLIDDGSCFLGGVWSRLIHDNDQVAARVVSQHLLEEIDYLG